jgi:hypothetical protein
MVTYVVPVGGTHLQPSGTPLRLVTGRPIAYYICKSMTTTPLTGSHAPIPFHGIRLGEIIP